MCPWTGSHTVYISGLYITQFSTCPSIRERNQNPIPTVVSTHELLSMDTFVKPRDVECHFNSPRGSLRRRNSGVESIFHAFPRHFTFQYQPLRFTCIYSRDGRRRARRSEWSRLRFNQMLIFGTRSDERVSHSSSNRVARAGVLARMATRRNRGSEYHTVQISVF